MACGVYVVRTQPVSPDRDELTAVQVTTQTWTAKATGRSATVDVVELFPVEDGSTVEIRVFQQDTHALMATLSADAG